MGGDNLLSIPPDLHSIVLQHLDHGIIAGAFVAGHAFGQRCAIYERIEKQRPGVGVVPRPLFVGIVAEVHLVGKSQRDWCIA
eukprot:8830922-Prorocentrum_lima.AAC.1